MVVVIGAGMAALTAAIRLARAGRQVTVLEASEQVGGLAGRITLAGQAMDGGPYILLDRPGLEWAFEQLGESLCSHVELRALDETWRVNWPDGQEVRIYRDLQQTAKELEQAFAGSGRRYERFIQQMGAAYARLAPFQRTAPPRPWHLLRPSQLRSIPFLLRPLGSHLAASGLPKRVAHALGIWTHIAGQPLDAAPAPLAFVPAIVHQHGAYVVAGGMHRVTHALYQIAVTAGVSFRFGTRVTRILRSGSRVTALIAGEERIAADHVVSNAPGISTLVDLVAPPQPRLSAKLAALPLQSPGVAAYMTATAQPEVPFLRFMLTDNEPCRLIIRFDGIDASRPRQVRLLGPVDHGWAQGVGAAGQSAYLQHLIAEPWYQAGMSDIEVVGTRIPAEWGRRYNLYRDSMNPVMTAAYMRRGRLPHRSPLADNLFLAGSANHPGQWVSLCAISGLLAADALLIGS